MEISILNRSFLGWVTTRAAITVHTLILHIVRTLHILQIWTIAASVPIANQHRSVEFRARLKQAGTKRDRIAFWKAPNFVEQPHQTEVWLPQVWLDELAEMIDGERKG